ncbi:MAG: sigma-70 family RNA polymerase sigma factor [Clostridium sp.]|nr:sigma-70 family RNA polymerase sigma factor [Clostridium sp.]
MEMDSSRQIQDIVNTYSDMVYKLALARTKNKYDADDVFQEVFIRYMKHYETLKTSDHTKNWLIRVTINCSHNVFTSSWYKKTVNFEENLHEELSFSSQENETVYFSVLKLAKKYRTVIHLFYYEDMSIEEISKALEIKEGTIKSQLHRGRNLLKDMLEGEKEYV